MKIRDLLYREGCKFWKLQYLFNCLHHVKLVCSFHILLLFQDPKEYLPFLNQLQKLETNYQRYSIDKHLKRHDKALQHIAKCPEHFTECLQLVKEHKLYSHAMELFTKDSEHYKVGQTLCLIWIASCDQSNIFQSKMDENVNFPQSNKMYLDQHPWLAVFKLHRFIPSQ